MDTERSDRLVRAFLENGPALKRKKMTVERTFSATPEILFPQLCPSRECDWINGWECDLIYTTTGYNEPDCIFTTPPTNSLGPGLWIITRLEANRLLDAVRIIDNFAVEHFTIELTGNPNGTTTGRWTLIFTALSDTGNEFIDTVTEDDPELHRALDGLEHFLTTGKLIGA